MPPTPLPPPADAAVRVAYEPADARAWTGRALVIDLFRFSNTICALLESGRGDIRVYASPPRAVAVRRLEKNSDLFSEINLGPGVEQYDNSPYTALHGSNPARTALSVTNSGSPAVTALTMAKEILIACFANFPALVKYCRSRPMPTLIVPACLFYDRKHVEDFICARALERALAGEDTYAAALQEIHASGRVLDFMTTRPDTGKRDMEIALKMGIFGAVPRVKLVNGVGTVENAAIL
ncbi:MAG: 2-phosphosulfolactate phosphatase [Elusimicrobia bacterium]|nr:2-phosphosulfolactate phosphatase [Elusimicrobiota bacterium]